MGEAGWPAPESETSMTASMTKATKNLLGKGYDAVLAYMANTPTMPLVATDQQNGVTFKTFMGAYGPVTVIGT